MNTVRSPEISVLSMRHLKLGAWLVVSTALSWVLLRDSWTVLVERLSPSWVFGQQNASAWAVLALCVIGLLLKRRQIWQAMDGESSAGYRLLGLSLLVGAFLMPSSTDWLVLQTLLASLGVFVFLFGQAAKIPSILLLVYAAGVSFSFVTRQLFEEPYTSTAVLPIVGLLKGLRVPIENTGMWVQLTTVSGEPIRVLVNATCAGTATLGIFFALFGVMALDSPLPRNKALWMFALGAVGTWFQSVVRILIILFAGYFWGDEALWAAHQWTVYVLFPLWYLVFTYLYFRQFSRTFENPPRRPGPLPYRTAEQPLL